jgi:hypothetical protein
MADYTRETAYSKKIREENAAEAVAAEIKSLRTFYYRLKLFLEDPEECPKEHWTREELVYFLKAIEISWEMANARKKPVLDDLGWKNLL